MLDYIIVGFGLAGMHMANQLDQHQRSYVVFDAPRKNATQVAGGLSNPLILKRFTKAWKADHFIPQAEKVYMALEEKLEVPFYFRTPIYRKIKSAGEQNNWFFAAESRSTGQFMTDNLSQLKALPSPFKYGVVKQSSLVNTDVLTQGFQKFLAKKNQIRFDHFDYSSLKINEDFLIYKNLRARKIIFCEGFGLRQNPFFKQLPLIGNKGEYLILKIPELALDPIIKTAFALIPLGNDYYKFGASYARNFKDSRSEPEARDFLLKKLKEIIDRPFEVIDAEVGIRPTVRDRRPLLGRHPVHPNLLVFNGLGSHGVMIAPTAARWLYAYDNKEEGLPDEVDVKRYYQRKVHHLRN